MAQPQNQSLFSELGFPELSTDEIIRNRTQEQQLLFQKLISDQAAAMPAVERGVFQSFANLGRALTQKNTAELTDKEKQQFAIMQKSNQNMQELHASPEWKELDDQEKALRSQEAIARAALELGDVGTFSTIALKTAEQRQKFKRDKAALDQLESSTESNRLSQTKSKLDISLLQDKVRQSREGTHGVFAVPGENGYDFGGPPTLVTGKVGPDGVLRTVGGEEYNAFITPEHFDTFADNREKQLSPSGRAGGGGKPLKLNDFSISASEFKAARDLKKDIQGQTLIMKEIGNVFKGSIEKGENPEALVGTAGGFVRLTDNIFRTARGVVAGFKPSMVVGGTRNDDGSITGGRVVDGITGAVEEFGALIAVPPGIDEKSVEAQRYRSAVMQAVYVDARLAEPGARQLSDADIKNAMDRLGVNSGNPEAIFTVLLQNFRHRTDGLRNSIETYRGVAEGHLPGSADRVEQMMFGDNTSAMLDENEDILTQMGESLFGPKATVRPLEQQEQAPGAGFAPIDLGDGFTLTPIN